MKPKHLDLAYQRVISRILEISYGSEKENLDLIEDIASLYNEKGGTWKRFYEGHPNHVKLLKTIIKYLIKQRKDENGKAIKPTDSND
jgi:hypothetical protein